MTSPALLLLLVVACACSRKEPSLTPVQTTKPKPSALPVVGADADAHGCKSSAGYTWSGLEKRCVLIFEEGRRLDPVGDPQHLQMSAFVIIKKDSAELFTQTEGKRPILVRKSEGAPYTGGGWQLVTWKGYALKKDGKILFAGK